MTLATSSSAAPGAARSGAVSRPASRIVDRGEIWAAKRDGRGRAGRSSVPHASPAGASRLVVARLLGRPGLLGQPRGGAAAARGQRVLARRRELGRVSGPANWCRLCIGVRARVARTRSRCGRRARAAGQRAGCGCCGPRWPAAAVRALAANPALRPADTRSPGTAAAAAAARRRPLLPLPLAAVPSAAAARRYAAGGPPSAAGRSPLAADRSPSAARGSPPAVAAAAAGSARRSPAHPPHPRRAAAPARRFRRAPSPPGPARRRIPTGVAHQGAIGPAHRRHRRRRRRRRHPRHRSVTAAPARRATPRSRAHGSRMMDRERRMPREHRLGRLRSPLRAAAGSPAATAAAARTCSRCAAAKHHQLRLAPCPRRSAPRADPRVVAAPSDRRHQILGELTRPAPRALRRSPLAAITSAAANRTRWQRLRIVGSNCSGADVLARTACARAAPRASSAARSPAGGAIATASSMMNTRTSASCGSRPRPRDHLRAHVLDRHDLPGAFAHERDDVGVDAAGDLLARHARATALARLRRGRLSPAASASAVSSSGAPAGPEEQDRRAACRPRS